MQRAYLVTACKHNPHRRHATALDMLMRTASARGEHAFMQQLEAVERLRYEVVDDSESDMLDPYAAGIAALRAATVNPSPLFQMAAERDRLAADDRAAFEERDKAERLAALTKSRARYKAERMSALDATDTRHAEHDPYAAPDPYAADIKRMQQKK